MAQLRKLNNPPNPPAGSPPHRVSQLRPPASAAPPSTHTARSEHTEHPISRRHHHGPHVCACLSPLLAAPRPSRTPTLRLLSYPLPTTSDRFEGSASPLSYLLLSSGQQLRFLRAFLATPPSPPLSALLDHLIRVPNDRRPRAILQHTFQLKIWDPARPPFRQSRATRAQPYPASQRAVFAVVFGECMGPAAPIRIVFSQFRLQSVAPLTLYIRRSMTPLFPGSKQLATSHLRVVTFIIAMCRAETSTDPMFGLYDLKNAGPPMYASYRSPHASAVPPLDLHRREPRDSPFRGRDRRGGSDLAGAL
ncbi:hypothetical protein C8J57DRAFT_1513945 [Mycena rebaudengoi]|nr:hypothetical protein C8J57DRAFT_1513945 [Mycena rebaudengoi]